MAYEIHFLSGDKSTRYWTSDDPMREVIRERYPGQEFRAVNSESWNPYTAKYVLDLSDKTIYLFDFVGVLKDGRRIQRPDLFPFEQRVAIRWFSGPISVDGVWPIENYEAHPSDSRRPAIVLHVVKGFVNATEIMTPLPKLYLP